MSFGVSTRNALGLGASSSLALSTRGSAFNAPALAELNFVTGEYYENGTPYTLAALPGWTFTRTTAGYGENAAVEVTEFAINAPRIIAGRGLLIEATGTDLLLQTADLDNAEWLLVGATPTADFAISPTGAMDAARVQLAAGVSYYYQANALDGVFGLSIYVKRNGGTDQTFRLFGRSTVVMSPDLTATSAWQRVSLSGTTTAGGTTGLTTDVGANAADLLIWAPDMKAASAISSYFPSVAAPGVRGADVASITFTGGTTATVTYGGGLIATVAVTTSLNLGASSGGAWVGSYVESVVVR